MEAISHKEDKIALLEEKTLWTRRETLKIHKIAPETRIASSLSAIEILVALYYGGILSFDPQQPLWESRDRFIVSKGHGSISLYPILADFGFFDKHELKNVCMEGSFLGGIPDPIIPGYETVNGSLGHGLGVGCGIAVGLKRKGSDSKVFILLGDGELYEGSAWEAIMFAAHHRLDNLIAIIDFNKVCMLGCCREIIDLSPLEEKFRAFNWDVKVVNGHNIPELYSGLKSAKDSAVNNPRVIIADTIKGHGVPELEKNSLSHVMSLKPEEIDRLLKELE
jgi:transketolase